MVSTTFGAVAGPNLVDVMGRVAVSIGIPALAGPFILAATAYILAGLVLLVFLRPDPLIVAKAMAISEKMGKSDESDSKSNSLEKTNEASLLGPQSWY